MKLLLVLGCVRLLDVSVFSTIQSGPLLMLPSVFESAVSAVYWFRKAILSFEVMSTAILTPHSLLLHLQVCPRLVDGSSPDRVCICLHPRSLLSLLTHSPVVLKLSSAPSFTQSSPATSTPAPPPTTSAPKPTRPSKYVALQIPMTARQFHFFGMGKQFLVQSFEPLGYLLL
jgi:hypothetical protein